MANPVRKTNAEFPFCRSHMGGVVAQSVTGTLTLTRLDCHTQVLTPDAARTVKLPDADLAYVGEEWELVHGGTAYALTITDTTGAAITTLGPGEVLRTRSDDTPAHVIMQRVAGTSQIVMFLGGSLLVDGDGARTNGGGLHGDVTLTEAAAAYAVVSDASDAVNTPRPLATAAAAAGYAANYQVFPGTAAAGDYCAFGAAIPFCEIAFDVGTAGDYTAGSITWEYWDGAAWAALTLVLDNTGTTATDGTTSLERDGAISFIPPSDWASTTVNGTTGYWVRAKVVADMTTPPVLNSKEHEVVTVADALICPVTGTVIVARLVDGTTGTLHTAADVKFVVVNQTTGEHSGELAFAQDKRADLWAGLSLAVNRGDTLAVLCTQEDGTNEVINGMLTLSVVASR